MEYKELLIFIAIVLFVVDLKKMIFCLLLLFMLNNNIFNNDPFHKYRLLDEKTYKSYLSFLEKFNNEKNYKKARIIKEKIIATLHRLLFHIENDIQKELKFKRKIKVYDDHLEQKIKNLR